MAKSTHEQLVGNDVEIVVLPDGYSTFTSETTPDSTFNRPTREVTLVDAEPLVIVPGQKIDDD